MTKRPKQQFVKNPRLPEDHPVSPDVRVFIGGVESAAVVAGPPVEPDIPRNGEAATNFEDEPVATRTLTYRLISLDLGQAFETLQAVLSESGNIPAVTIINGVVTDGGLCKAIRFSLATEPEEFLDWMRATFGNSTKSVLEGRGDYMTVLDCNRLGEGTVTIYVPVAVPDTPK